MLLKPQLFRGYTLDTKSYAIDLISFDRDADNRIGLLDECPLVELLDDIDVSDFLTLAEL